MTGIGSSMMAAHMAGKDLSTGQAIKAKKNRSEICDDSEEDEA